MSNREYIEKYAGEDEIIQTWYQVKDRYGKTSVVDGIVNPLRVDNRQIASVTDQQGQKPHCAGYSICGLAEAVLWKRTGRLVNLDADQVYAKAKQTDGDLDGAGTYLECAIKAALQLGGFVNPERITVGFIENDKTDRTVETFKYLIHKYDFVHLGFDITTGWYNRTKQDPYVRHTGVSLGGHAVLGVGYSEEGAFIQNSWGAEYGANGFVVVPWDVFKKELMYGCYVQNCYDGLCEKGTAS